MRACTHTYVHTDMRAGKMVGYVNSCDRIGVLIISAIIVCMLGGGFSVIDGVVCL